MEQDKGAEKRADEQQEQQDKPRQEQEQRPKDLDPKDKGKDVKGGAFRASDVRLKTHIRVL